MFVIKPPCDGIIIIILREIYVINYYIELSVLGERVC